MSQDGMRRTIRTFLIAFFGIFLPGALQFLHEVTAWANSGGQKAFPDMHSASFILVAAVCAGMIALLNMVVVWLEDTTGKGFLRTPQPKANPGQGGAVTIVTVVVVVLIVLLVIWLL